MKHKMKNWEYLVIDNVDDNKLNELGINGWELINVVYFPSLDITFMQALPIIKFYFKKQVVL